MTIYIDTKILNAIAFVAHSHRSSHAAINENQFSQNNHGQKKYAILNANRRIIESIFVFRIFTYRKVSYRLLKTEYRIEKKHTQKRTVVNTFF